MATILVCPGTYEEQLRIRGNRDGLTLRSVTPWAATIRTPAALATPLGFGFLILVEQVDDVTIRGFRLRARTAPPCAVATVMVGAVGSLRSSVQGNRISTEGSAAGSSCGFDIGVAFTDSIQNGQPGSDPSARGSMLAAFNSVRNFRQAGVGAFGGAGRVNLRALYNVLRLDAGAPGNGQAQGGVVAFGRAAGLVHGNAVLVSDDVPVEPFAGVVVLRESGSRQPAMVVRRNALEGAANGVAVLNGAHVRVIRNTVRRSDVGIGLYEQAHDNVVAGNDVAGRQVGLAADVNTSGNLLRHNRARSAGTACVDASAGPANTWTANTGATSNPPALCHPAP
jgi:hypothetical protein